MKLIMYLGQVNHGILNENGSKVSAFLQVFSRHTEKLLKDTPEPVGASCIVTFLDRTTVEQRDYVAAYAEQSNAASYVLSARCFTRSLSSGQSLKSQNLCKNILRAVNAALLPDMIEYPMADQVTIRYYTGVLSFFNEDFKKAEADLQFAFDYTLSRFHQNRRLILHYLIPTRLLRGSLPSAQLLEEFPELSGLYKSVVEAIKTGNVQKFDEALVEGGDRLIGLGTYLTVERSRVVAVRMLFKRVYLLTERATKLNVAIFQVALAFVGVTIDEDEVECMLANMIFKGYIRGYLSHEKKVLVLSAKDPFPSLESVQ
ncbi:COP9 signalosome (CSN) subunit [Mortierella sp. GBA30]|nr:COP9 signalosome (CSN) subunit [Mortierella sp. GBA30]